MQYQMVKFREEEGVAILGLAAPINTEDELTQLIQEIFECCQRFRMNEECSVLVITEEAPGMFVIRNELGSNRRESPECISCSESIAECEKPVLIGIMGDAVDLGLEMALAGDVRVASETSRFGLCQIKAGLMPWEGGTQRLSRIVGKGKSLEMTLTGELINAQEANRIGLISRVASTDKVTSTVLDLAKEMASKSPISLQYCKEAITKGMDLTLDQGLRLEADLYFLMHTTYDRKEGIKAFQEKRAAKFKGR